MFYLLFCETFESTEMTRKMFYINFCEIFGAKSYRSKNVLYVLFIHIKISSTGTNVLSFIPSGMFNCLFKMAYANLIENMPLWSKIYAKFWDRQRPRFPGKKSREKKHTNWCKVALWKFFPITVQRFGFFFQDLPIRVKLNQFSIQTKNFDSN